MQNGRLRQLVLHDDLDPIALAHPDLRARDLAVVGHRGFHLAGRHLPLELRRPQRRHLGSVDDLRPQPPPAVSFGLGRERRNGRLMHLGHLLGRHARMGAHVHPRHDVDGGIVRLADPERSSHSEIRMARYGAKHLVGSRL